MKRKSWERVYVELIFGEDNPVFEVCLKNKNHPYHQKNCDSKCPDYWLCSRGEVITEKRWVPLSEFLNLLKEVQDE